MARSVNNLSEIFKDMANAIRTKTGKTTTFTPRDFADEILQINTSGGETPLPQLYPPLNFTFNSQFGKMSCELNSNNGAFESFVNFYLNNDLLYRGNDTEYSNIYYSIKQAGENNLYTSMTGGSLFKESRKPVISIYVEDKGGYFVFRPDGYKWAAKLLNTYSIEENPNGETVIIDEIDADSLEEGD